jgi:hypothetical protein
VEAMMNSKKAGEVCIADWNQIKINKTNLKKYVSIRKKIMNLWRVGAQPPSDKLEQMGVQVRHQGISNGKVVSEDIVKEIKEVELTSEFSKPPLSYKKIALVSRKGNDRKKSPPKKKNP